MSIKAQDHFFDVNQVSQCIKVQKPYFAFQQIWQDGNSLVGSFAAEQSLDYETGIITAGELGRHLAILGSCAAVVICNGSEGYYLALKADFINKPHKQTSVNDILYAGAQVLSIDKRSLKISAQAWNIEPVAELLCEYAILSPALFQRRFRHYASDDLSVPDDSPYQYPIPLHSLTFHKEKLDAFAGPLSPQQCAGHFYGYPCWPVAIISQTAVQVVGELLKKKYGFEMRFFIRDSQLSAEKLIGANSILRFNVEIIPLAEKCSLISLIHIYHDEEEVVHLIIRLELILPG